MIFEVSCPLQGDTNRDPPSKHSPTRTPFVCVCVCRFPGDLFGLRREAEADPGRFDPETMRGHMGRARDVCLTGKLGMVTSLGFPVLPLLPFLFWGRVPRLE